MKVEPLDRQHEQKKTTEGEREREKLDSDDYYFSLKLEINDIFTADCRFCFALSVTHRTNNSLDGGVLPKTFLRAMICARLSEFYELNNADLQVYSNFSIHTLSLSLARTSTQLPIPSLFFSRNDSAWNFFKLNLNPLNPSLFTILHEIPMHYNVANHFLHLIHLLTYLLEQKSEKL